MSLLWIINDLVISHYIFGDACQNLYCSKVMSDQIHSHSNGRLYMEIDVVEISAFLTD